MTDSGLISAFGDDIDNQDDWSHFPNQWAMETSNSGITSVSLIFEVGLCR